MYLLIFRKDAFVKRRLERLVNSYSTVEGLSLVGHDSSNFDELSPGLNPENKERETSLQ